MSGFYILSIVFAFVAAMFVGIAIILHELEHCSCEKYDKYGKVKKFFCDHSEGLQIIVISIIILCIFFCVLVPAITAEYIDKANEEYAEYIADIHTINTVGDPTSVISQKVNEFEAKVEYKINRWGRFTMYYCLKDKMMPDKEVE